jgi:polysaccharide export outer membrane protein
MKIGFLPTFIFLILAALSLPSCMTHNLMVEETFYSPDSLLFVSPQLKEHVIKAGDKIAYSFYNHDDLSVGSVFSESHSGYETGKWITVNAMGAIPIPGLGRFPVRGLTETEAELLIESRVKDKILSPMLMLRVVNKKFSVLGEVKSSGYHDLEKDQITILEAIAIAGGTKYPADKKKVRLIRDGKTYIIDLTRFKNYELANVLIKSDDMIIVPSRRFGDLSKGITVLLPIASTLSAAALIISLITR